jgi:citrate lyase subunit beta/citryl-CoA lyase
MRSLLFVPADSERKLAKSEDIDADVVILDLEDSVAPANKDAARALARAYLARHAKGRRAQLWVRLNAMTTPDFEEDLAGIMAGRPDGIMQPKTTSPDDVIALGQRLDVLETEFGLVIGSTSIIPVATETPEALFAMGDFARCGERLAGVTWGAEDLGAEIGASANRDADGNWTFPFQLARSLCMFAASAAGVAPIDTIHANFKDSDGLRHACNEARRDGFAGKMAIHPSQVEIINEAFTPSREEIEMATRIVAAFAEEPDAGALSLDGRMIDIPHLKQARKILAMAGL